MWFVSKVLDLLQKCGINRIGFSLTLGTWYRVKRYERLEKACRDAVERFKSDGETTYCNIALNHIAILLGYRGFVGLLANAIVRKLETDPDFAPVSPEKAKELADMGELVIAGQKGEPNGHVAVVFPNRPMVTSGKWNGAKVPVVANVGKTNAIFGANYAFVKEPKYYAWIREGFGNEKDT